MTDREQIRREALQQVATDHHGRCNSHHGAPCDCYKRRPEYAMAEDYLALLAELEQAERERKEAREIATHNARAVDVVKADLEAQLSKVPALVEAAKALSHFLEEEKETREPPTALLDQGYVALETSADYEREEQLSIALVHALAAWEKP